MEAVGQLTGGIAHEFRNLLHIIIGNLRLLKDDLVGQPEVVCEILNDAISAAVDGAELTAKLLSFSRSKLLVATSADLHDAINNAVRFLSRKLVEKVVVKPSFNQTRFSLHWIKHSLKMRYRTWCSMQVTPCLMVVRSPLNLLYLSTIKIVEMT